MHYSIIIEIYIFIYFIPLPSNPTTNHIFGWIPEGLRGTTTDSSRPTREEVHSRP